MVRKAPTGKTARKAAGSKRAAGRNATGADERVSKLVRHLEEVSIEPFLAVAKHRTEREGTACASKEGLRALIDVGQSLEALRAVFVANPRGVRARAYLSALVLVGDALANFRDVVTFFPHESPVRSSDDEDR